MSLPFDISPKLEEILNKLGRRDRTLAIAVRKKIQQIIASDSATINERFKNLRHDLSNLKRVRIGSFVLVFRVKRNSIVFEDFDHHDRIYKR